MGPTIRQSASHQAPPVWWHAFFFVFPIGGAEENVFVMPRVDCKAHTDVEVEQIAGPENRLSIRVVGRKIL